MDRFPGSPAFVCNALINLPCTVMSFKLYPTNRVKCIYNIFIWFDNMKPIMFVPHHVLELNETCNGKYCFEDLNKLFIVENLFYFTHHMVIAGKIRKLIIFFT